MYIRICTNVLSCGVCRILIGLFPSIENTHSECAYRRYPDDTFSTHILAIRQWVTTSWTTSMTNKCDIMYVCNVSLVSPLMRFRPFPSGCSFRVRRLILMNRFLHNIALSLSTEQIMLTVDAAFFLHNTMRLQLHIETNYGCSKQWHEIDMDNVGIHKCYKLTNREGKHFRKQTRKYKKLVAYGIYCM